MDAPPPEAILTCFDTFFSANVVPIFRHRTSNTYNYLIINNILIGKTKRSTIDISYSWSEYPQ